ncbi:MAG: hypothetical protein Kow0092_28070 [Deferrisomatales bacterium]
MTLPPAACGLVEESFGRLEAWWAGGGAGLVWACPFILPPWLESWWGAFGGGARPWLRSVREGDRLLGVLPFVVRGDRAGFLGGPDLCDYQDVPAVPGREGDVLAAAGAELARQGVRVLELDSVHERSGALKGLTDPSFPWPVEIERVGVTVELELPPTWEDYLAALAKKERHELRRKLRRLHGAGTAAFRRVARPGPGDVEAFLRLFRASREDKAAFLEPRREGFFRTLIARAAEAGLLRLFFLELEGQPAAAVLCFEHAGTVYLYNNGYDPEWGRLSVGLLSKVCSVRDAIERGLARYDFLRGAEPYKMRLGGRPRDLYRCRVHLRQPTAGTGKDRAL